MFFTCKHSVKPNITPPCRGQPNPLLQIRRLFQCFSSVTTPTTCPDPRHHPGSASCLSKTVRQQSRYHNTHLASCKQQYLGSNLLIREKTSSTSLNKGGNNARSKLHLRQIQQCLGARQTRMLPVPPLLSALP